MATSGSFNTSGYEGRYLQFSWSEKSQNVADNTTTIAWTLKGAGTGESGWYYTGNFKVVIDGKTVYQTDRDDRIQLWNGTTVASGTHTITHNDDGSRSFTASAQAGIYYFDVNCTGSGSFTLDTIARASQPSLITWPETTNDVGYFGETISIHMNRKSDKFTHTVRYAFGSRTGTIATNVTTGVQWKIPESLMELLPADLSGSGLVYVDTYNGGTLVGTKYTGFTAKVPASVKPTVSATLKDINGVDSIYGKPVQGLSQIQVTVNASLAYGSPIVSYSVQINGAKYDAAQVTSGLLQAAGNSPVRVTVTDQRGRTSDAWTYTMNVLAYTGPQVTALSVHRVDDNGNEDDQGNRVRVTFSSAVTKLAAGSTAAYTLRYKKSSTNTWTTVDLTSYKNNFAVSGGTYTFAADNESAFDVELTVADPHGRATRTTSASTAFAIMDWNADGTGICFGGLSSLPRTFQNNMNLKQVGNRYTADSAGDVLSTGFVRMAQIVIKLPEPDTPITFVFTRRQQQAPMTVHVRLKADNLSSSSVASIRYEGDNYGAYLAPGGNALTWNLYVQKGVDQDHITLQDWWMSKPMQTRVEVTFPGDQVAQVPTPYHRATPAVLESALDFLMPVGFVLTLYSHADPNTMYPGTTWARITNAFLWAVDSSGTIGQTGGAKEVTLTVDQLPKHSHGSVYSQHATGTKDKAWYNTAGSSVAYGPVETGGGQAHNNMPPYVQVSVWRRTA